MLFSVDGGSATVKTGNDIERNAQKVNFNPRKFSVFTAIAALDGDASNLTKKDISLAKKYFNEQGDDWQKLSEAGVTKVKYDSHAGVATILMSDDELLRIDFRTWWERIGLGKDSSKLAMQSITQVEETVAHSEEEGKGDGVDISKLDDLMLHQEIKNIGRNGIRFLKADYFNDDLYGKKGRVIIKYSLSDLSKIRIYTLENEFICEAQRVMPVHPMAEYFGDVKDKEELKFKLRQQKALEKQTIKEIKKYLHSKQVRPLDWQNMPMIEEQKDLKIAKVQQPDVNNPNDGRPNFEHKYERYEWHLKNGFDNDKDVAWFKEYELSDEYLQIYGADFREGVV